MNYAGRVEELYSHAVTLGGVMQGDTACLQNILFAGLRSEFSLRAAYKNDVIKDYDTFKLELRKIENDINAELQEHKMETKTCHSAVTLDNTTNTEVLTLLEKMNQRIDSLQKEKEEMKEQMHQQSYRGGRGYQGYDRGQGNYRYYRGHGRGNTQY